MRTLESDVPKAISSVLSTHEFQKRKELIESLFVPHCKFWHLFFQTMSRRELFGVYQMWGTGGYLKVFSFLCKVVAQARV